MKNVCYLLIAFTFGCGGGGGGGSSSEWRGPLTPGGLPLVAGNYSTEFGPLTGSCSDGSDVDGNIPNERVRVEQSESAIAFVSLGSGGAVLQDSGNTGTVGSGGHFTSRRRFTVAVNGSRVDYDLTYSGQFFPSGIAGDLDGTGRVTQESCDLSATFTGDKE